jgi:hypothetical protein
MAGVVWNAIGSQHGVLVFHELHMCCGNVQVVQAGAAFAYTGFVTPKDPDADTPILRVSPYVRISPRILVRVHVQIRPFKLNGDVPRL